MNHVKRIVALFAVALLAAFGTAQAQNDDRPTVRVASNVSIPLRIYFEGQEIRGYENVTRIANAPDFIKGVTNLRGVIVPIVDLRIKFHLDKVEYGGQTVVIVVNVEDRVVGIVVDGVSDVMTLSPDQIKPAPEFGVTLSSDFLSGLGSLEDRMLVIVDIDKLLTSDEMELVEKVAE